MLNDVSHVVGFMQLVLPYCQGFGGSFVLRHCRLIISTHKLQFSTHTLKWERWSLLPISSTLFKLRGAITVLHVIETSTNGGNKLGLTHQGLQMKCFMHGTDHSVMCCMCSTMCDCLQSHTSSYDIIGLCLHYAINSVSPGCPRGLDANMFLLMATIFLNPMC